MKKPKSKELRNPIEDFMRACYWLTPMPEEFTQESFERSKKKIYGDYTSEYNSVDEIGRMFLQDAVKGYNSIDYLNKLEEIDLEYVNAIRKKLLRNDRHSLSIVKGK